MKDNQTFDQSKKYNEEKAYTVSPLVAGSTLLLVITELFVLLYQYSSSKINFADFLLFSFLLGGALYCIVFALLITCLWRSSKIARQATWFVFSSFVFSAIFYLLWR